jgi:hypothetical protein
MRTLAERARREHSAGELAAHIDECFRLFDNTLDPDSLMENYFPQSGSEADVSDEELEMSFKLLGKDPGPDRHFDCGYCGHGTCKEMARSVALANNLPENCVALMKARSEETKSKSSTFLDLIHNVSEYLLLTDGVNYLANVEHALMALCYSMDAFSASLWKNGYNLEEKPVCQRVVTYPSMLVNNNFATVTIDDPPGWLDNLMEGNSIMRLKVNMTVVEQQKFLGRNVNSILLTPIIAHGDFWGFISILKQEAELYSEEDAAVITICSNILASSLIHHNLSVSTLESSLNLM